MTKTTKSITKSQKAIKTAILALMAQKSLDAITMQDISHSANVSRGTIYLYYTDKYDMLDKLIQSHIDELRGLCASTATPHFESSMLLWFEYFETNYLFFATMLSSKGAPYFHNRFFSFIHSEIKNALPVTARKNDALREDVLLPFIGSALLGTVEWWFLNEMPHPPRVMAKQLGLLLNRNL